MHLAVKASYLKREPKVRRTLDPYFPQSFLRSMIHGVRENELHGHRRFFHIARHFDLEQGPRHAQHEAFRYEVMPELKAHVHEQDRRPNERNFSDKKKQE